MAVLFIGIGNDFRRDDGAGVWLLQHLAKALENPVEKSVDKPIESTGHQFAQASGEGTALMALWEGQDKVVLFDALMAQGHPGRVVHLQAQQDHFPSDFFKYSSHAFSLAEAVELSRVLGRLPSSLEVFGVEGEDFSHGQDLSPAVARACEDVLGILTARYLPDSSVLGSGR